MVDPLGRRTNVTSITDEQSSTANVGTEPTFFGQSHHVTANDVRTSLLTLVTPEPHVIEYALKSSAIIIF